MCPAAALTSGAAGSLPWRGARPEGRVWAAGGGEGAGGCMSRRRRGGWRRDVPAGDAGRWVRPAAVVKFPSTCGNVAVTCHITWPHAEFGVGALLGFSRIVLGVGSRRLQWVCSRHAVQQGEGPAVSPAFVTRGGGLCCTREGVTERVLEWEVEIRLPTLECVKVCCSVLLVTCHVTESSEGVNRAREGDGQCGVLVVVNLTRLKISCAELCHLRRSDSWLIKRTVVNRGKYQ